MKLIALILVFGDSNLGKVWQIKPAQQDFRCTINIILLTYLHCIALHCVGANRAGGETSGGERYGTDQNVQWRTGETSGDTVLSVL